MRLYRDWMACMTRPVEFFDELDTSAPMAGQVAFFVVFWTLGYLFASLSMDATAGEWIADYYASLGLEYPGARSDGFMVFMAPFLGVLGLGVYTVLTHLGVRIFVRDSRPIGVTARGMCYVSAPQVLNLIPWVGWFVSSLWSLYLAIVAVMRLHRASAGRSFAAVVAPPLVLGILATTLFVFVILGLALAVGGGR